MVALHEPRPVLERSVTEELAEKVLAHFQRGNKLFDAEDYDAALREYDGIISAVPEDATFLNNRGAILGHLGRYEEALECYDQALAIARDDHIAHHNRGVALAQLKRFEDAVASYDQALSYAPADAGTLANRGLALAHLGQHKEALASIDEALNVIGEDEALQGCRRKILTDLLTKLADEGVVDWAGGKPKGSDPLIKLTPGPDVSDYVIENRR